MSETAITTIGNDEQGRLAGKATGQSYREILLSIAAMATEQQAQQILARLGRIS